MAGAIAAALAACLAAPDARAVGLDGTATAFGATSTRDLDDAFPAAGMLVEPAVEAALGMARFHMRLIGRAEYPWPEDQEILREAYTEFLLASAGIRIGKQVIKWGKGDGINPTDNLAVFDYTLPVSLRDASRTGTYALLGEFDWEAAGLELAVSPYYQSTRLPLPEGIPRGDRRPDWIWKTPVAAARFKVRLSGLDASVSYFNGYLPLPYISLTPPALHAYRAEVLGADAEGALGKWILRGEAAWASPYGGPAGTQPSFRYILAAERKLSEEVLLNVQFFQSLLPEFSAPDSAAPPLLKKALRRERALNYQTSARSGGLTGKIIFAPSGSRGKAELTGVVNYPGLDSFLSPRAEYGFSDHWKGSVGAEWYQGGENTFFGQNLRNDRIYAESILYFGLE